VKRRTFLWLPAALAATPVLGADVAYPRVVRGTPVAFPRDHGAHPSYRTEWWYLTGWLGGDTGFQVTFFRNRPGIAENVESRFAATQLLFAHAALADPKAGKLVHDQRSARAGFGLAQASEADTDVRIDDWSIVRSADGYRALVSAREFELDLRFAPTQPVLLQGDGGFSSKGPRAEQASHYYSWPQLRVTGTLRRAGSSSQVSGIAWLDHEWSSEALAPEAAGWDWTGINADDGSALMAFRMRGKDGGVYWAGGSHRSADGRLTVFRRDQVTFEPLSRWRSSRTGTEYPTAMRVRTPAVELELQPMMQDQELDARPSTGTVYWEGAATALHAGRVYGRGYLELTGYGKPLNL
jgi:predicted secreted hydrolase